MAERVRRARRWFTMSAHQWRLTIGYAIVVAGILVALQVSIENQDRIEEQAQIASAQNCHTSNELKDVLRDVLLVLVGPPDKDGYERRLEIFHDIEPILVHANCPPVPPYGEDP